MSGRASLRGDQITSPAQFGRLSVNMVGSRLVDRLRVGVLGLVSSGIIAHAATVMYDFNITWVTADPTGTFPRPVIGINGQWPIPIVECALGDTVVVNVHNQLGNQSTSLHFHGLYQNGTGHMDGAAGVTQCGIPPGASLQYNFTVRHCPR